MNDFEFLRNINIGQYLPGTSPLHRLDPRAKIVIFTVFILVLTFTRSLQGLAFGFGYLPCRPAAGTHPPALCPARSCRPPALSALPRPAAALPDPRGQPCRCALAVALSSDHRRGGDGVRHGARALHRPDPDHRPGDERHLVLRSARGDERPAAASVRRSASPRKMRS